MPPQEPITPAQPQKHILVIEDENFISDLYERALVKGGYAPKVVVDGQAALQEAQTNTYDVILLDIMLPTITGTEILNTLRGPGAPPLKAKIIVTTNLELDEAGRQEMESKADGYIVKADITPRELVSFLDQIDFSSTPVTN
jgi:DNA-binding response OmpR family regulator